MTRLSVVSDDGESKGGRPSGEFDPWSTEKGNEYDPNKFYTRSTNQHDHSADIRFRLPPHLAGRINEIVSSKRFPQLRSTADFYRDAAVHRLHHLNKMMQDPELANMLNIEIRLAIIEARQQEVDSLREAVEKHKQQLESAWQSNDYDAIADSLADVEESIPFYRNPYRRQLQELVTQFKPRLKAWLASGGDEADA